MLFSVSSSYTLPQLYVEDRSRTPSLLDPDEMSVRDQQIRLYCQTIIAVICHLQKKSLHCIVRLQKRLQQILDLKTHIDLTEIEPQLRFERNLQLFMCLVEHRLRSIASSSPKQYDSTVDKLQLLLIGSGCTYQEKPLTLRKLRKLLSNLVKIR